MNKKVDNAIKNTQKLVGGLISKGGKVVSDRGKASQKVVDNVLTVGGNTVDSLMKLGKKPQTNDGTQYADEMLQETLRQKAEMGYANIIIAGKSGVGKSTLINKIFGKNLAKTGQGQPVTQEITRYAKDDIPVRIYDTAGFELSETNQRKVISDIREEIMMHKQTPEFNDDISCIWYCIQASGNRFEENELQFVNSLVDTEVPVILVFTKVGDKKQASAFLKAVKSQNEFSDNVKDLILVRAKAVKDAEHHEKEFGLVELIEKTYEVIPEEQKAAFNYSQKLNLNIKAKMAKDKIHQAAIQAAAIGAAPIPFADAPILVGLQLKMLANVTNAYGVKMTQDRVMPIVYAALGTTGASTAGKFIVTNLVKLVPGAGAIIGGTISGITAVTITLGLGYAYARLMEDSINGKFDLDKALPADVKKYLQVALKDIVANGDLKRVAKNMLKEYVSTTAL